MAIRIITIDDRIKSATGKSSVLDYNGTLMVIDSEGLKVFNGSELELVYGLYAYSNAVIYGDDIYYIATNGYQIKRYSILDRTETVLATFFDGDYRGYSLSIKADNIYIMANETNNVRLRSYVMVYNISNNTLSNYYTGLNPRSYRMSQNCIWGDHVYNRFQGATAKVLDVVSKAFLSSDVDIDNSGFYGSAMFSVGDNLVSLFGKNSNGTLQRTIRTYNVYTKAIETENIEQVAEFTDLSNKYAGQWGDSYCVATADGLIKITYVTYDLTYNFYDYYGNPLLTLTGKYPITQLLFTESDNKVTYVLTTLTETITGSFTAPQLEGKRYNGMSFSPKTNRVNYIFGTSYEVSIYKDADFYLSAGSYRPPDTSFEVELYQNTAEPNRVDKGTFLTGVGTLSGALREECSILTPSIVYQSSDVPTFNYVYIPIFNRYYFVTSLSSVGKNLWRMELNCDVLMTYKDSIFLLQGVVARQEYDFNEFLIDDKLPAQKDATIEFVNTLSTTLNPFDTQKGFTDYIYVLTVVG